MKRLESVKLVQFLLYEQQEFRLEEITGLFGRNGSGKSSALDAVQIAMMGANKNQMHFNAQADNKSHQQSRTLRSYCLGQFGDTIEPCARSQATTYITLVWLLRAANIEKLAVEERDKIETDLKRIGQLIDEIRTWK